jgi:hypothetical protein
MPVRIVFDHPGRQTRTYIGRLIARFVGGLLAFVGLTATVVAIPTGFVVIADIITSIQGARQEVFSPDFPVRQVDAAFAAAFLVALAGLRYGRRLIRGRRNIVLFLRRFGYDGSMKVVTFAVANTIGVSWRLVTLDDAEIAPVGVDSTSKYLFAGSERLAALAGAFGKGVLVSFQWTIGGMWAVVAVQAALVARNWRHALQDGTIDPYVAIFASVMERRVPVRYFGFSLPGAFAILATAAALSFVGMMIVFATLLAAIPFFGFVMMATSSAEALRKAEKAKTATIGESADIAEVVRDLSRVGRQTFAPRLVVVRVATAVWHETVSALASVASATIIDVSEPTPNLAWELGELQRIGGRERYIFIGDHERIAHWADTDPSTVVPGSLESDVIGAIGDHELLAYTTDRRGMRRFAHALYGMLLDVPPLAPNA